MNYPSGLLSLNDDVLIAIFSFLNSKARWPQLQPPNAPTDSHLSLNLRTIILENFDFLIDEDGLVIKAIGAMHHLEHVSFQQSGPETVSALPKLLSSRKLTSLALDFDDTYYEEDIVDLPALFAGLSSAPGIRTLDIALNYLPTAPSMRPSHNFSLPQFITLPSPPSRALFRDNPPATFSMSAEDRWPARLKELELPRHITIAEDTVQHMKPVSCLSFGGETPIPGGADFENFLQVLATFRPTLLELHTKCFLADASRMWDTLRSAAPQLRSLSIVVADGECNVREYVDPLIAALRSTSIVHLSLEFPPTREGFFVANMTQVDSICAAEVRRVEALRPLPLQLAEAVPSLRVLALFSCWPARMGIHTRAGRAELLEPPPEFIAELEREDEIGRLWGPDSEFLNAPMRRIRELWAEIPRDKRWWWVEGKGAARRPVEIWREDGERARDMIKRADFDPEKGLDGFYSDKCRYEW
ncbi:uncharacterized protein BXZ73DRAFT_104854 [Epithele typhae]|uniref:uncharacterized protein n=1 Tax=Epithele typhae TaxID=378194 RepID=UPI0020078A3B|nr:uncharacterized protein BXZ73DRAFT_104854 [Epithele typhae]KAH9919750.1 hypothetical protein BXZ73DRAFT_104854 [Epithele typhae]